MTSLNQWPDKPVIGEVAIEKRKIKPSVYSVVLPTPQLDHERFSQYKRLRNTQGYVLRFIRQLRSKGPQQLCLTLTELKSAQHQIVKDHQAQYFQEEIQLLREERQLPRKHKFIGLNPFIDETDGLMKVGGRLYQSDMDDNVKHPVLLQADSHLVKILIRRHHQQCLHAGPQSTLYNLRQQFWFVNARNVVRRIIQACTTCARFAHTSFQTPMGPLPEERITPSKPFTNCGIDFAGPFHIKLKGTLKSTEKVYISLFVCFATKAIHLEIVSSLTTEACIAALKRFVARRGVPAAIFSDNGTNFIGARNELIQLKLILAKRRNSVSQFATNLGTQWTMIPPRAPHFGGLWEAGVKAVKLHLKKIMGNTILSYEEFLTLVIQIEGILNSRPLSPMSSEPNDLEPLTPGHFLMGTCPNSLPEDPRQLNISSERRYHLVKKMRQQFWNRWTREYLNQLQNVSKWKHTGLQPKVNDLVLVAEDNTAPLQWPIARILELYLGNDDIPRVAKIKTKWATLIRPVSKLRPFPSEAV